MKRKMTLLALGGNCGGLGARGLVASLLGAVAAKPSRASKSNKAHVPKPSPAWRNISRRDMKRERTGGCCQEFIDASINVNEFVGVEEGQTELRELRFKWRRG